ncbi:MAG: hypothetical protein Q8P61_05585 [Candidatus Nanopelagicales bacterium]|nr:hypothetical protein [Candidatus Nanopelagicales bacterium]
MSVTRSTARRRFAPELCAANLHPFRLAVEDAAKKVNAGTRNHFSHDDPEDVDEQLSVEYSAAGSAQARWISESTVEVAE